MTYTGKRINLFNINAADICIVDISHHLSQTCRFGGATQEFYSVAQHSVHVSAILADEYQLWGLLHDAAEAYVGDVIRPVKYALPDFQQLEKEVLCYISKAFELDWPIPEAVKMADETVLEWELSRFEQGQPIMGGMQPRPAKNLFMSQYKNLTGGGCHCGSCLMTFPTSRQPSGAPPSKGDLNDEY